MEVFRDVELVEDDLALRLVEVLPGRLDVGLPHVHGNGLDPLSLGGREGRPERIEALLLAVLGEVEDPAPLETTTVR
jgi:hypothetical protein